MYQSQRILTVQEQVLTSLKLLALGSFQSSTKDNINISQSTVMRFQQIFRWPLFPHKEKFIEMPKNANISKVKLRFYAKAHFSDVIGAIDCTHVQGRWQKNFQGGEGNEKKDQKIAKRPKNRKKD